MKWWLHGSLLFFVSFLLSSLLRIKLLRLSSTSNPDQSGTPRQFVGCPQALCCQILTQHGTYKDRITPLKLM